MPDRDRSTSAIHAAAALAIALAGASLSASASTAPTGAAGASAPHPAKPAHRPASAAAKARPQAASARASAARQKPAAPARAAAPAAPAYGAREDVLAFARQWAQERGQSAAWVEAQLAEARFQASVTRFIMPPPAGQPKNWAQYRARFIEPRRIQAGLRWWTENERWLAQAEQRWGVPAAMVVAIVGVETFYGRHTGGYRVIDALATLSFDFPSGRSDRSAFFRKELAAFLDWCQAQACDPASVKGSYAGAMGLPQFMPSNVLRLAQDFDGDGRVTLDRSAADAIGSVAHYFASHGWRTGLPTHFEVRPPEDAAQRQRLLAPDIVPSFTVQEMLAAGAWLPESARHFDGRLALVALENGDGEPSYVAGTDNFYAVTRYNWSSYYALAVITLAEALQAQRP